MANRPALNNVTFSTFAQPLVGEVSKSITVQGPYNAQQSSAATSDIVTVSADYGVYDTTASLNLDVNSVNWKDPG